MWGTFSDRVGRKPVLVLGVLGNAISLLMFGLSNELWQLFIARGLSGILSSATFPTAMAYVSDSTTEDERGGGMGILGAAMGIGMILGPGVGGWLADDSLSMPFFMASAMALVTLALILFFLPESLPAEQRKDKASATVKLHNDSFLRVIAGPLAILFFMAFLVSFGLTNFEGIFGLHALEKLSYGPERVGTILTVIAVVAAIGQGVLIGRLTKWLGEVTVIRITLVTSAIGFVLLLRADTYPLVLVTTGFFVLSNGMLRPSVMSLLSKRADESQGIILGLTNSFMSLGRIVGPIWAGSLYDINYDFPYLSGSVIMIVGFTISMVMLSNTRNIELEKRIQVAESTTI